MAKPDADGPGEVEDRLAELAAKARACRLCAAHLPLGPNPVFRVSATARVLIVGQAPGTKVHASGVPWDDASGDRLRAWLAMNRQTFYDEGRIAVVPMGFCYPGVDPRGGDKPPRPECAPTWHGPLLSGMPNIALTLVIGQYAQARYLGSARRRTMTETVAAWRDMPAGVLPLPHPSWRNTAWLKRNPWFEAELVPELRRRIQPLID